MWVVINKRHINMGQPKFKECPVQLAFEDATGLDNKCVQVHNRVVIFRNYYGFMVYSMKLPDDVVEFRDKFCKRLKHRKFLKFKTPMIDGKDIVDQIVQLIKKWDGCIYDIL